MVDEPEAALGRALAVAQADRYEAAAAATPDSDGAAVAIGSPVPSSTPAGLPGPPLGTPGSCRTPGGPRRPAFYQFDSAFGAMDTCKEVYKGSGAEGIVEGFLQGVNGAVCAYGATATGKTYTMKSLSRFCVKDVFAHKEWDLGSVLGDAEFDLRLSAVEVYNEQVYDLLQTGKARHLPLRLLEGQRGSASRSGGVVVDKALQVKVTSREECDAFLDRALRERETARLKTNERSSRSHFVARLHLRQTRQTPNPGPQGDGEGKADILSSTLTLVDLAGAEHAAESRAEGMRLKEAGSINQSLLAFGIVMSRLAEGGSGHVHVPYRSSKLTRLLRPALDGNSQFLLLCTISPLGGFHLEQTRSTLQFGQRALSIKVQPVVNISKPPVKLLQEEVLKLQTTQQEDAGGAREPEDPEDGEEEASPRNAAEDPRSSAPRLPGQLKSRVGAITRRLMRRGPRKVSSHPVGLVSPQSANPKASRPAAEKAAQRLSYSPSKAAALASHEVDGIESEIVRTAIKTMKRTQREKDALVVRLQDIMEGEQGTEDCADIMSQCVSEVMQLCNVGESLMRDQLTLATADLARAEEESMRYRNELEELLLEVGELTEESGKEVARWEAEIEVATNALEESGIKRHRQAFELTKARKQVIELQARLAKATALAKEKSEVLARQDKLLGEMEKDLEAVPNLREQKVALTQEVALLKSQLEQSLLEHRAAHTASEKQEMLAQSEMERRESELREANEKLENLTRSYVEATSALAKKDFEILATSEALVEAQRSTSSAEDQVSGFQAQVSDLQERLSAQVRQVAALQDLWTRHGTAVMPPDEESPLAAVLSAAEGEQVSEKDEGMDAAAHRVSGLLVRVRQLEALAAQQHALVRATVVGATVPREVVHVVRPALQDTTNVEPAPAALESGKRPTGVGGSDPGLAALCAEQAECMAGLHRSIDEMVVELSVAVEATDGQRVLLGQVAEQNADKIREMEEREALVHSNLAKERGKTATLKHELEQQIEATQVLRDQLTERTDAYEALNAELEALREEVSDLRSEHFGMEALEEDLALLAGKSQEAEQRLHDQEQQWLHSGVLCTKVGRNSKGYCRFVRLSPDRRCLEWFHVAPVPKRTALRGGAPLEKWSSFYSVKGMDRDVRLLMRSPWEIQWVTALQKHVQALPPPVTMTAGAPALVPSREIGIELEGISTPRSKEGASLNVDNGEWNDVEWTFGSPRYPPKFNPSKDLQSQKHTPRKNFRNLFREKIANKAARGQAPPEPAFALR